MFEFAGEWEQPFNIVFLAVTGFIALHGIRFRNDKGDSEFVHLLFGCIAALFFSLILFRDVLGVVNFQ